MPVHIIVVALVLLLGGCTSDATVGTSASTAAPTPTPTTAPTDDPDVRAAEPADDEPLGTQPPDLSPLDQVVEDLGVSPETVLGVSITACASRAEGLDRAAVEQRLRDMEGELSLEDLDAEQLTAVVDVGIAALCPERGGT